MKLRKKKIELGRKLLRELIDDLMLKHRLSWIEVATVLEESEGIMNDIGDNMPETELE